MRYMVIVCLLVSTRLCGQDAREIVNHYLDTVSNGNIGNWDRIQSLYTEGEGYYSQNDLEQKVNLLRPDKSSFHRSYGILPYQKKIEIYEDSSFTKPQSTFYYLKDKIIILLGNVPPMERQAFDRDEFYSPHLPVQISRLVYKSKSVELLGLKTFPLDGVTCYEIRIETKGRTYMLYINTETFFLDYWNGREDADAAYLTRFYDYKRVDRFLIPMSESGMHNGVVYFYENTSKYIINSDIDPEIFNYPGK